MASFSQNADDLLETLFLTPDWKKLCEIHELIDNETVTAIVSGAAKFSEDRLAPLNVLADRDGCHLNEGRVTTPKGYFDAYAALADEGWIGLEHDDGLGGQGLPTTMFVACDPLFERACPAFMMLAGSTRSSALLLSECADEKARDDWVPNLLNGSRTATICISESGAGSDVGRIKTKAEFSDGKWLISGQKIWISFGDHDLTFTIGHCLLARTSETKGTRGLSLFLVPNKLEDGSDNNITTERIEEKMGLHGSPTCALHFADSEGILLGEQDQGLAKLFTMIRHMRLLTACQGLGVATGALHLAQEFADERRQGGNPQNPPKAISSHPDVQRQLYVMQMRAGLLQAALFETSVAIDLGKLVEDKISQKKYIDFSSWMLPLVKVFGAEAGFDGANSAIQILGGSGYTKDYPAEQALRDSRVFAIYEGTTGMQAQDFLFRRHLGRDSCGTQEFLFRAKSETAPVDSPEASIVRIILKRYEILSNKMLEYKDDKKRLEIGAEPFLRATWVAVSAWLSLRLIVAHAHSSKAAKFYLGTAVEEFELHAKACERDLILFD